MVKLPREIVLTYIITSQWKKEKKKRKKEKIGMKP